MTADWNELTLVQEPAIELLVKHLGYTHATADELHRELESETILVNRLKDALIRINPFLDDLNLNRAVRRITHPEGASLMEINQSMHLNFINGISLQQDIGKGKKGQTVRYIDLENPEKNEYLVVDEFTVKGQSETCRADLVVFVNGIPLVVIECKSPRLSEPMVEGINQLRRYQNVRTDGGKEGMERLFHPNLLSIALARDEARYGTIYAKPEHYGVWKDPYPLTEPQLELKVGSKTQQNILLHTVLDKSRLLDILKNFTVFEKGDNRIIKKCCRYQQYRAVQRTMERIDKREGGVIWHTQGSGKSLTMLFLGLKLKRELSNPTLIFVTDRIDLDEQLHGTFTKCGYPNPEHADSCHDLRAKLKQGQGMTLLTTLHKFENSDEDYPLSERDDVYVLLDEAHRSQYKEMGANMREALPKAVFLGFTGTPVDKQDKSTFRVFGNYIDKYSIQQAVDDQATVPILYEGRLSKVHVEGRSIEEIFEHFFAEKTKEERSEIIRRYAREKDLMQAPMRIEEICLDIIKHYKEKVRPDGYKAQIVANGREAALVFKKTLDRLGASKSALIVSTTPNDSEEMKSTAIQKDDIKTTIEKKFKAPFEHGGDIAFIIVTDMLLTGFDAPIEQVMYIDKPLQEHNLLQAIARCNRTYTHPVSGNVKTHGLIVDYYGLSSNLKNALAVFDADEIQGVARPVSDLLPILEVKHRTCMDFLQSDDHDVCLEQLEPDDHRSKFKRAYKEFSKAINAVLPDPAAKRFVADHSRATIIYMNAVRKYERQSVLNIEGCGEKVKELIDTHVRSHGIYNLVEPVSLFSSSFMEEAEKYRSDKAKASEMEHALKFTIRDRWQNDPVFWDSIEKRLMDLISNYESKRMEDVHFLDQLTSMRDEILNKENSDKDEGFSHPAESAIYGILGNNKDLKDSSIELFAELSELKVVDWQHKEEVLKDMRRTIKRKIRKSFSSDELEGMVSAVINLLKVHL
jgi:type I restriction enzyme R subunit